jgi:hypothetical protein
MRTPAAPERSILIFAIWAVLGFLGLGFVLEGMVRESFIACGIGLVLILAAFAAHIVVNFVFRQGFTRGEAALGIGVYGLLALVFVLAWASGRLGPAGYAAGLAMFGVVGVGFIVYLATRHGLRGAFSQFHIGSPSARETTR